MSELLSGLLGHTPAALLFDLDGTLVDSVPDLAVAVDATLEELGLAAAGERRVRDWVGNGALKLVERALAFRSGCDEAALERDLLARAHRGFLSHYTHANGRHSRLYPGVREALVSWRQRDVPLAVVTNKPIQFVPHLLRCLDIDGYFAVVLGGDSVPVKKPDPGMLLRACGELAVAPQRCVMVGDSRNDIEAARRAAMPVVAVSYGYNHGRPVAEEAPDRLIDDFRALIRAD